MAAQSAGLEILNAIERLQAQQPAAGAAVSLVIGPEIF
jgi:hypothetical protein